ncbi:MAG TPA: glycosyltransferase family 2 protein [Smithella sp.]|nr:glycosyltransferase family 2 protein [Smithella sp.]
MDDKTMHTTTGQLDLSQHLTIVIPALNEALTITDIIHQCKDISDDIVVIDGNSPDGTADIARRAGAKIVQDHGRGKGEAIRTVIPHLQKEITVFIDADGSHDPRDIPALVSPIIEDRADHVSASRLIGGSSELHGGFDECFRLMGSSFITACINNRFGVLLSESQNGFRAIKTNVLRALDLREDITTIEQEMIIKTLKKGFRMGEVPSHEHKRKAGYSKISVRRVAFRYVYSMVKYLYF